MFHCREGGICPVLWMLHCSSCQAACTLSVSPDEVFRGHEPGQAAGRSVSAADVVLYGVNLILPLMSQDLLKVIGEGGCEH